MFQKLLTFSHAMNSGSDNLSPNILVCFILTSWTPLSGQWLGIMCPVCEREVSSTPSSQFGGGVIATVPHPLVHCLVSQCHEEMTGVLLPLPRSVSDTVGTMCLNED